MGHMNPKLLLFVPSLFLTVISACANPIDLGQTAGNPANPPNVLVRLNDQITIYNNANTPDLPTAVLAGTMGQGHLTGLSITLDVTGWTYLSLKWADTDQFYYVGNDSGDITFDSTVFNSNNKPQNLSGYDFFNPTTKTVPDFGSTALMLGAALSGLGLVTRRLKK
jgi:hypothetical protein